jgi:hypothetical protein
MKKAGITQLFSWLKPHRLGSGIAFDVQKQESHGQSRKYQTY